MWELFNKYGSFFCYQESPLNYCSRLVKASTPELSYPLIKCRKIFYPFYIDSSITIVNGGDKDEIYENSKNKL